MKNVILFLVIILTISLVGADMANAKRGGRGRSKSKKHSSGYSTTVNVKTPAQKSGTKKKQEESPRDVIPNYDIQALCSSGVIDLDYSTCVAQETRARGRLNKMTASKIRRCIPSSDVEGRGSYVRLEQCAR